MKIWGQKPRKYSKSTAIQKNGEFWKKYRNSNIKKVDFSFH